MQRAKDWDSFEFLCLALKSRHGMGDDEELQEVWEDLDYCERKQYIKGGQSWSLKSKDGQKHNTVKGFVAEWRARKGNSSQCAADDPADR